MAQAEKKHEPIRQSVYVDCPIEEAFRLFAEKFGEWWPLAAHSIAGESSETCEIEPWEGGRVLERSRSGEECEWGTVTKWDPPGCLEFTWHGGVQSVREQTVEVEFSPEADGTRVTLIHSGWHLAGVETCFAGFAAQQLMAVA